MLLQLDQPGCALAQIHNTLLRGENMRLTFLWLACVLSLVSLSFAQRLPATASPENYNLSFTPDLPKSTFRGEETIRLRLLKPATQVVLNAIDINFEDVTVTAEKLSQKAKVSLDKKNEEATLSVDHTLPAGSVTIQIKYTGTLNEELRGFYLGKQDDGHRYAATQFEATDARRAFPSFDEPAFKATFDITIVADKRMTVISNTKSISDVEGPSPDKHTVRFATTPKMSCYLVAFVIGDFEFIEGSADGIPIRVYTNPGKKDLASFALATAEYTLHYYDHYFGIKYPYGKLDMIGLSDFGPGAMENTACITYREALLMLDDKHASIDTKKFVAFVIAHEMAHQWFGDLVTMQWWDDVWLNEGFASWMSSKPIEAWKPEWHIDLNDVRDTTEALNADSLENTHPIHQEARTADEILELADAITYDKTASVLRMLESYLGEETFRVGVNDYLRKHAYGNAAAADFWNSLAHVSKKPVDKIMSSFVEQPGPPFVSVKTQCQGSSGSVSFEQKRYLYDRSKFEAGNDQLWQIPICMKSAAHSATPKCELLTRKQQSLSLATCAPWVDANAGAHGYYRSGYDAEAVRSLAKDAETSLSPAERIMLLSDVWASVRVDREKIGDYLVVAQGLQSDRTPQVLSLMVAQLEYIGRYLITDSDQQAYRSWVSNLLAPIATDVGWEKKAGENEEIESLRGDLMRALGTVAHDSATQALARKLSDQALENPDSVDPELAASALPIAAANGDSGLYDKVLQRLKTAENPEQKSLYEQTLVSFTDPALVTKTLDYAVSEARSQDADLITARVMRNPRSQKIAWDFVRSRWGKSEKSDNAFGGGSVGSLVASTGTFCDPEMRDQVRQFFSSHPVPTAARTLKQALEQISYCVDMKERQGPQLASWLQSQSTHAEK
jgi:aminopeptidase N